MISDKGGIMAERFRDKVVLVTGSAGGLGRGFALGFGREGAHLVLADVNVAGMEETAAMLREFGADSSVHQVDLAVESEIHAFAAEVKARHSRLDVLINNAGLAYGEISFGFDGLGQAKWLHFLSVNTIAPLLLGEALRDELAVGPGCIINQSSMASYMPGTAYGITKAALNAMSYGMASSFGRQGIRVNSIAPGLMETPASKAGVAPDNWARLQAMQMLKLEGGPDDIVNLGLFLASDDARFITNNVVQCDAGNQLRGFR
jgi:3-oxoacyl-[acyl-carrier protein] reductase